MSGTAARARSIYRAILRELPDQPLSTPSPIQQRIRASFSTDAASSDQITNELEKAEQYVQYVKAQRLYVTLLERYNPGMNMEEAERHTMTVRRVGMNMPLEWKPGNK